MAKELQSKKKGCLPGCLFVFVIIIALVVVLVVFGYLNRHKILPFVTNKLGIEASSVIQYAGTKAETGLPSQFLDNAYKIDLPQGNKTVKVTTSNTPADQTYDKFIQYFKKQGWEVRKEMEALEATPEQVESVSKYLEGKVRAAELSKDGRRRDLAVTRYNNETVGIVWHSSATESKGSKAADSVDAHSKNEKTKDTSNDAPVEVSGTDPEDIPLYPDSIRTSYQKVTEGDKVSHLASYAAEANKSEVFKFYEKKMEKENWEIVKKAESEEKNYLEAARAEDKVHIIIQKSSDYTDYTEIEIAAKYRSKQ